MGDDHDITRLLSELSGGDPQAASKLIPVVYDELRHLAAGYMRRERPDHTLQPTALVHEAYVKLLAQRSVEWQGRARFFWGSSTIDAAYSDSSGQSGSSEARCDRKPRLEPTSSGGRDLEFADAQLKYREVAAEGVDL